LNWTQQRKRIIIVFSVAALIIIGVYLFYTEVRPVVIFGLRDDFAHAIAFQQVPEGIPGIKAEDCGVCHREIYEEWKSSIHAKAFVDPFFQAYWQKDNNIWICLNCHTPLENQQPELIVEIPRNRVEKAVKKPNPHYDPDFQQEGITCAVCHVRDGVILGPFTDSKAPHPTRYDPSFTSTDICYRCHQVPAGPFQFYRFGPCGTYPEYEGGHYYEEGYVCQTCHMPEVERPVAIGGPVRKGRRHLWRGGHDPDQIKQAVTIGLSADPVQMTPGTTVDFTLTLQNSGAGHNLPTGDPDRYFTIEFVIQDEKGKILKKKTHTMGRWIIWQPVIWEVYDNRLAPLASRDYTFRYRLPSSNKAGEPVTLRATVRYHIMTEKAYNMLIRKYGLTADDPYVFTIFEKKVQLPGSFADMGQELLRVKKAKRHSVDSKTCNEVHHSSAGKLASVFGPDQSWTGNLFNWIER
jgi:hypothetical protein